MIGKLIHSCDHEAMGEYLLDVDTLVIGRRPECDLQIDNLTVSGTHARVITITGASFIEDLGSTNGTLVNGERIDKHPLADGDLIMIGRHALRFVLTSAVPESAAASHTRFAETVVIDPEPSVRPGSRQATAEVPVPLPPPEQAAARDPHPPGQASANIGPARVRLLSADGTGRELPLTKALTTVGRPGIQVAAISRRHNGDYLVHVDGGEGNLSRPRVNGTEIGVTSHLLVDRDIIEIAGVKLQYSRNPDMVDRDLP